MLYFSIFVWQPPTGKFAIQDTLAHHLTPKAIMDSSSAPLAKLSSADSLYEALI